MNEIHDADQWEKKDVWLGLLFLLAGGGLTVVFVRLLGQLTEPETLVILAIGGLGWLSGPLFLILGANAVVRSLMLSKGLKEKER